jgi:predicted ATP-dependent serine protease
MRADVSKQVPGQQKSVSAEMKDLAVMLVSDPDTVWKLGKQAIKHTIDVHMHLSIDQKPTSETFGKRIMKIEKNRFGFSNVGYFLGMNDRGLYEDGTWQPTVDE